MSIVEDKTKDRGIILDLTQILGDNGYPADEWVIWMAEPSEVDIENKHLIFLGLTHRDDDTPDEEIVDELSDDDGEE